MMDMPTLCASCGDICELRHMRNIGNELYCEECYEDETLERESNE